MNQLTAITLLVGIITAMLSIHYLDYAYIDSSLPILLGAMIATYGIINNDARGDAQKDNINHSEEVLKRWWILPIAFVFSVQLVPFKFDLWDYILMIGFISSYYWILFDQLWKYHANVKQTYMGTTAWLDKIFKQNFWLQLFVKLLFFSIFVVLLMIKTE